MNQYHESLKFTGYDHQVKYDGDDCEDCPHLSRTPDGFGTGDSPDALECTNTYTDECPCAQEFEKRLFDQLTEYDEAFMEDKIGEYSVLIKEALNKNRGDDLLKIFAQMEREYWIETL